MENNETSKTARVAVSFAAIDPYIEQNIISPTEKIVPGKDMVEWGDRNIYPDYLLDLFKTVPTLRSVIGGTVDFITGNDISIVPLPDTDYTPGVMNTRKDTIRDQVHDIAQDYELYGGFALQVIRSFTGKVVEVYYIDMRFLRSNKDNSVFYYSEKWEQSRRKVVEYPCFYPFTEAEWMALDETQRNRHASSIVYVKNNHTQVYPLPPFCAAVKACEIERGIDDFHLNSIENAFTVSQIINFNNGVPDDKQKEEIEAQANAKFSGHQNAGRIMYSWNDDKDHATTFSTPEVKDFGDRYNAVSKWARQQIFTAFRANPNLFGIPTENLGFSSEEYESAFRLYNRTCVKPVQQIICDAYDKIYGQPGVLTIKPFSLDESSETNVK